MAGAAAVYFAPQDSGSYEVLLWVFWRASHGDLRWQWLPAPGCNQSHIHELVLWQLLYELFPGLDFQTYCTQTLILGVLSPCSGAFLSMIHFEKISDQLLLMGSTSFLPGKHICSPC